MLSQPLLGPGPGEGPGPAGGRADIFVKTKKNLSESASDFPALLRLDLLYVSQNKGFGNSQTPSFGGATTTAATAATAAEEFPGRVQPPSHHTQGFNIPFGHTPHSDIDPSIC